MTSFDDYCGSDALVHLRSRRSIIIAAASAPLLVVEPLAAAAAADSAPDDERFMRLALDEARQGDYAFGAVIVRDGQISRPRTQSWKDQRRSDSARGNGRNSAMSTRTR